MYHNLLYESLLHTTETVEQIPVVYVSRTEKTHVGVVSSLWNDSKIKIM